jgi:hypothetical protein
MGQSDWTLVRRERQRRIVSAIVGLGGEEEDFIRVVFCYKL